MICPACSNTSWRFIERRRELSFENTQESVSYYICPKCGIVRRSPQPTEESLRRYYSTAWQTRVDRLSDGLDHAARWVAEGLKPYTTRLHAAVDVGAPTRNFLERIQREISIERLDIQNPQQHEEAAGECWLGGAESNLRGNYELVTSTHVLEHVARPQEFLEHLATFVEPHGGFLYIEVPSTENEHASDNINRDHLWHYPLPALVWLCTSGALRDMDFHVLKAETCHEPKGWPTNRILLRANARWSQESIYAIHFGRMLHRQETAYRGALLKIFERDPALTCLYGACETLSQIGDQVEGADVARLKRFEIYDAFKAGKPFLWSPSIKDPKGGLPPVALITTKNWQSAVDIKATLAKSHPDTLALSLFFD